MIPALVLTCFAATIGAGAGVVAIQQNKIDTLQNVLQQEKASHIYYGTIASVDEQGNIITLSLVDPFNQEKTVQIYVIPNSLIQESDPVLVGNTVIGFSTPETIGLPDLRPGDSVQTTVVTNENLQRNEAVSIIRGIPFPPISSSNY